MRRAKVGHLLRNGRTSVADLDRRRLCGRGLLGVLLLSVLFDQLFVVAKVASRASLAGAVLYLFVAAKDLAFRCRRTGPLWRWRRASLVGPLPLVFAFSFVFAFSTFRFRNVGRVWWRGPLVKMILGGRSFGSGLLVPNLLELLEL